MNDDSPYRICFVCSGNICRSPMAEVVMARRVAEAGIGALVLVDSAGTGDWHIGERADRRAVSALAVGGYDGGAHRAKQFDPHWFGERDLVIALDRSHLRTLRSWAANEAERDRVQLLRAFDPAVARDDSAGSAGSTGPERSTSGSGDLDVADPYYDGPAAFEFVLGQIETACRGLLAQVQATLLSRPGPGPGRIDITGTGARALG
jgi:protein-tyrosine phosphatase